MATYAEPTVERRSSVRRQADPATPDGMAWLVPIGRACFSAILILSAFNHFNAGTVAYAEQGGTPMAGILVPLSGVLALLAGLSIVTGFRARIGAWLAVLFLVPVTYFMHDFWAFSDAAARATERVNFLKNLAMIGGALLIAYWGAGPVSVDASRRTAW